MKIKTTLLITLCLINACFAALPGNIYPDCNNRKLMLNSTLINHFTLLSPGYTLKADDSHPGFSWGGLFDGQQNSYIYCVDGDQFIDVVSQHNANDYCVIDSGTEFGGNDTQVHENHGITCHLSFSQGYKTSTPYINESHSAMLYNVFVTITE